MPRQVLEQLADFIDRHGDSRFSPASGHDDSHYHPVRDRAGWWDDDGEDRVYLFTAEGMREALKGFDFDPALEVLEQAGVIRAAFGTAFSASAAAGCSWRSCFVGGIMNLAWIAGIALLVLIEKTLPWGRPVSQLTGAVLVAWGVVTLVMAARP